jgi:hypothetical protein
VDVTAARAGSLPGHERDDHPERRHAGHTGVRRPGRRMGTARPHNPGSHPARARDSRRRRDRTATGHRPAGPPRRGEPRRSRVTGGRGGAGHVTAGRYPRRKRRLLPPPRPAPGRLSPPQVNSGEPTASTGRSGTAVR